MKVWTIPDHIKSKKYDFVSKQQYMADHAPDFIKEHTGLTPTAIRMDGYFEFKSDDLALPGFLKKDNDGVISPRLNSKRGKDLRKMWSEKFSDKKTASLVFHVFSKFRGRSLRVRFDTINGVEYIVDSEGIDLVAEGCVEVDV